jgi:hypothetical protein
MPLAMTSTLNATWAELTCRYYLAYQASATFISTLPRYADPSREPHKRTAGIFDNVRKLPHPVEEYTGLVTLDQPPPLTDEAQSDTRSKIDRPEITRPEVDRPEMNDSLSEIDPGDGSKIDPIINNSSIKTLHTQQSARAESRFSLEECRAYADHLAATGQGITRPGGYATTIFRSGEAHSQIEAFLNPVQPIDITQCPDCRGSNFVHVDPVDMDKGVRPCKHERL